MSKTKTISKLNSLNKTLSDLPIKTYRIIAFISIMIAISLYLWVSDDAYQGFIQVVNLVENGTFGYNVIERVNTSTCILFEFLMIPLYFITRNLFLSACILNVITSGIAIYMLLFKFCKTKASIVATSIIILASYYFLCFCSSGLENSLIFMFGSIFLYLYKNTPDKAWTPKKLISLALIDSCLLLTRIDMAVIFLTPTAYIYLFQRKEKSIIKMILCGITGLMPFITWLLFSLWYYGVPFPTTFYAKLNTHIPLLDTCFYGGFYLIANFFADILFMTTIAYTIVKTIQKGNTKHKIFAISLIFRIIYLVYIGGDFMYGRMLTDIFFLSLCDYNTLENEHIICNKTPKKFITILLLTAVALTPLTDIFEYTITTSTMSYRKEYLYADERYFYSNVTSLQSKLNIPNIKEPLTFAPKVQMTDLLYEKNKEDYKNFTNNVNGCVFDGIAHGFLKLNYNHKYITDTTALGDMFLAHMPLKNYNFETWRVGHNIRIIPAGYQETVQTGVNVIKDKNLKEYYDIICELTRGDLFDPNRIKLIWDFNTGKYNYLLEKANYET